jgi:hypothetical protein
MPDRVKPLEAIMTGRGTYDLMIEKDAGNLMRILMGGDEKDNIAYWKRINKLSKEVIANLKKDGYWTRQAKIEG